MEQVLYRWLDAETDVVMTSLEQNARNPVFNNSRVSPAYAAALCPMKNGLLLPLLPARCDDS